MLSTLEKERKRIEKEQRKALKKQRKKKGGKKKKKRKGADDGDVIIEDEKKILRIKDFKKNILKLSYGKKKHFLVKII